VRPPPPPAANPRRLLPCPLAQAAVRKRPNKQATAVDLTSENVWEVATLELAYRRMGINEDDEVEDEPYEDVDDFNFDPKWDKKKQKKENRIKKKAIKKQHKRNKPGRRPRMKSVATETDDPDPWAGWDKPGCTCTRATQTDITYVEDFSTAEVAEMAKELASLYY
jgi:hypothetical protein